jgi:hypothetical protein
MCSEAMPFATIATLRGIKVEDWREGGSLTLVLNDEEGKAVAFFLRKRVNH